MLPARWPLVLDAGTVLLSITPFICAGFVYCHCTGRWAVLDNTYGKDSGVFHWELMYSQYHGPYLYYRYEIDILFSLTGVFQNNVILPIHQISFVNIACYCVPMHLEGITPSNSKTIQLKADLSRCGILGQSIITGLFGVSSNFRLRLRANSFLKFKGQTILKYVQTKY